MIEQFHGRDRGARSEVVSIAVRVVSGHPAHRLIHAAQRLHIVNIIEGDGHWLMFRSTIDTSGWAAGTDYGWNVVPTNGAVFSPTVDYNYDQGGGFRIPVYANDMTGDSFAFILIPEPTGALVLLAAAALFRRRA